MKNILVVDDSKSVRSVIGMTLKVGGYNTITAEDGQEALEYLQGNDAEDISLIITDVNMPNMDGITFIKELKNNNKYSSVPICILTTETEQDKLDESIKELRDAWITKPVQPALVLEVVNGLLEK